MLLFVLLEQDARKEVKIHCLKNITRLARRVSETYTVNFPALALYSIISESPYESLKRHTLQLLRVLATSSLMVRKWFTENSNITKVPTLLS